MTPEILADLKHQMTSSFHSTIFDVVKTGEIFLLSTNNILINLSKYLANNILYLLSTNDFKNLMTFLIIMFKDYK